MEQIMQENQDTSKSLGLLGRIFGNSQNAPGNIVGLTLMLTIIGGVVVTAINIATKSQTSPYEIWTVLVPIITASLGYVIGASRNIK